MRFKLLFLLVILFGSFNLYAQTDTIFYNDGDYSISTQKDSCNATVPFGDKNLSKFVALGSPRALCDRVYFKKGKKYDQKKSYKFGYVYLQFDTNTILRQHILTVDILQTYMAINITDSSKVFWSNFKSPFYTQFWLFENSRFKEVNITVNSNNDSLSSKIFTIINKNSNTKLANQWLNAYGGVTLTYTITFLPSGLINNYGYLLTIGNKPPVRIGKWADYNLFCDCYYEKEYYIK
ncbi:MAG: hypothetical protein KBE91_04515 [Bacteroidia bacterium]|nr:hypothetical protein [Bacteroidia bacterium]